MSVRQSIQKTENEEKPSDKKDSQGQSEVASADVKESQETKESKSPTNKESQVDNKESQFKESNVKSPKESRDQTKVKSSGEKESIEQTAVAEVTGFSLILHVMIKWKTPLLLILPPLLMSPLVLSEKKELRCAFCVCLMGVYWMTEALPLAVTALIPIVLYPLTQVMTCKAVAQQFINDTNFLYVGGLIVAIAIEKCFLHKRIALFVLNKVGGDTKFIMLGLMLGTASLSMFISNTATTAMMVPLMQSLINELLSCYDTKSAREEDRKACKDMSIGMALSICYASNIGGTGTLTGTPTNLVLVGQVVELFGSEAEVDYVTWFLFAFPLMCICMVAIWLVLVAMYLRNAPKNERVTALMRQKYEDQAVISFAEKSVAVAFGVLLVLWIFRDPGLFKGYGALLPKNHYTDTTSAMIIALLLFALPSEKPDFSDCAKKEIKEVPRLMDWNTVQKRFPWDVVLLLGGGFALAAGVKDSGLAKMIGSFLSKGGDLPLWVLQVLTMLVTITVTNFCSNVATTTILAPIVATLAVEARVHPLSLMLTVTIISSFAFVLPVGTPPNAIVFGTGMVSVANMAKAGVVSSVVCMLITLVYMKTFASALFSLSEFPAWAHPQNSTIP